MFHTMYGKCCTECAGGRCARLGVQLATARTPRRHFRSRAHQAFSVQCTTVHIMHFQCNARLCTPNILSAMHNFECIALHCTEMHTFSILSEQAASILSLLHIMCKTPNSLHILFAHICILKLVQVYTLQYAAGHSFTCRVFCIV